MKIFKIKLFLFYLDYVGIEKEVQMGVCAYVLNYMFHVCVLNDMYACACMYMKMTM